MKSIILFALVFSTYCINLSAQTHPRITGTVADTVSGTKISNATIIVLNARDSILKSFAWSGVNGSFEIDKLSFGTYLVLVTYPGYADFQSTLDLDSTKKQLDLGTIKLNLKSRLLEEVIVKGERNLIRMKGDTTEFDAKALIMAPNAKVEDILIRLPGIRVDNNGRITAYGQSVNKVLVDGEEFFGDDPTLVTRNLRADMVDKIQLYDRQPEQPTLTKINDEKDSKTLNVVLKEDKKNGYFGKLDGGVATSNFVQGQGMFNKFDAKQKFSAYGTLGNVGRTGLSNSDYNKYSTSSDNIVFIDGNIYATGSNADELSNSSGRYNGKGIPDVLTGGIHYDSKIKNGTVNLNYRVGNLDVNGTDNTLTQNNLESFSLENNNQQTFTNTLFRQKLDISYQSKISSTATMKVFMDATARKNNTASDYMTSVTRNNTIVLNESERSYRDEARQIFFNLGATYSKQFKKANRFLAWNSGISTSENKSKGFLNAVNEFIGNQGNIDSVISLNQLKVNEVSNSTYSSIITYSEPLSISSQLVFLYGLGYSNSSADRASFNRSPSGFYDFFDRGFSNDYRLSQLSNQFGTTYSWTKDKQSFEAGTKVSVVGFDQKDILNNLNLDRNLYYFNPRASYRYRFSNEQKLILRYYGNTIQPSSDQLQPLRNNIDPLNIINGNPNLNPAFTSSFTMDYDWYKALSQRNIIFAGSYSFTSNPIAFNISTDLSGKTTYQPDNINRNSDNFYLRANWSKKVKVVDSFLSFQLSYNSINNYGLSNSFLNRRNSHVYTGEVSIIKSKPNKFNLSTYFSPNFIRTKSSLDNRSDFDAVGVTSSANFVIFLPRKTEFSANANYQYQAKTQVFPKDLNVLLVNSSIALKLLKTESLKLSISANDLLNQNTGFRRNVLGTTITQNSYSTIGRYYMTSLLWDFSKFKTSVKAN